jgi:hypothetical protein
MKVKEAEPGQILFTKGRVIKSFTRNLPAEELAICRREGFLPGFLMPAWIGDDQPDNAWPGTQHDTHRITTLFYIGPIYLQQFVGGLKKHHIFLCEGNRVALEGYDFRHLECMGDV